MRRNKIGHNIKYYNGSWISYNPYSYVKEERVFVNFKEELSASKQIGEDTYITIRGKGRFKINKIVGTTRSGRLTVEIEK